MNAYDQGFIDKCNQLGVNPNELIKQSQLPENKVTPDQLKRFNSYNTAAFAKADKAPPVVKKPEIQMPGVQAAMKKTMGSV